MMRQVTKKGLLTVVATSGVLAVTSGGLAFADANAEGAAVGSPGVISGNVVQVPVHVPINVCNNTINAPGVLNPTFGNSCVNASTKSHQSFSHRSEGKGGHEGGYGREGGRGREGGEERGGEERGGDNGREGGNEHVGKAAHEGDREGGYGREGGRGHEGGEERGERGERGEHGRGHEGRGGRFEHDEDEGTAGAGAEAVAAGSPGVISGNIVQVPIDIPINVCNNPINVVVGVLNPTFGNVCANISSIRHNRYYKSEREEYFRKYEKEEYKKEEEHKKEEEEVKKAAPQAVTKEKAQLAKTGAGAVGTVLPASALMLLGGTALYRRARAAKR